MLARRRDRVHDSGHVYQIMRLARFYAHER